MKGYRTLSLNILAAIVPILQMTEVINVIPLEYLQWYMLVLALANVLLRAVTTTPIGDKA